MALFIDVFFSILADFGINSSISNLKVYESIAAHRHSEDSNGRLCTNSSLIRYAGRNHQI